MDDEAILRVLNNSLGNESLRQILNREVPIHKVLQRIIREFHKEGLTLTVWFENDKFDWRKDE